MPGEFNLLRAAAFLVALFLAGYAGLALLVYVFQSRMLYFPDSKIVHSPEHIGLDYDGVVFRSMDGVRLSGWFIPAENAHGVILFHHGNAGNISHRLDSIALFHHLRWSVFIFDYRGYGSSEGKPSEEGTYLDAQGAWDHLVRDRGADPSKIVCFGRSLGGAIAARLASEKTPAGLILEATFASIPDLAADLYRFLPVRLLSRLQYNTLSLMQAIRCPVLVVHSRDDEIIPYRHAQRIYEAAGAPKRLLEIRGSHNEGFLSSGRVYLDGLEGFLAECASGTIKVLSESPQPEHDPDRLMEDSTE